MRTGRPQLRHQVSALPGNDEVAQIAEGLEYKHIGTTAVDPAKLTLIDKNETKRRTTPRSLREQDAVGRLDEVLLAL